MLSNLKNIIPDAASLYCKSGVNYLGKIDLCSHLIFLHNNKQIISLYYDEKKVFARYMLDTISRKS